MPYRTELKRPDLKGHFPCSVCQKVFCHSSSLSRHRMQAHFKSYTCTQCNAEIPSSETLRSHMMRIHQIARMFMCRCCNWAFPDKTSLHLHTTSLSKTGSPGDVPVLARSTVEGEFIPNLDYTPSNSPSRSHSMSPAPMDEMKHTPQSMGTLQNASTMSTPNYLGSQNSLLNMGIFPPTMANRMDILTKLSNKSTKNTPKTESNGASPALNLNQMDTTPQLNSWLANWFANNPFQIPMADAYPNLLSPTMKASNGPTPPKNPRLDTKNIKQEPAEKSEKKTNGNVDNDASNRLLSVIDSLFSAKTGVNNADSSQQNSPKDRVNKRKAKKPQQLSDSFFAAISSAEEEQDPMKLNLNEMGEDKKTGIELNDDHPASANNEQPSPAISDSHTSGSSAQLTDSSAASPKKCLNCQVMKSKLEQTESRIKGFQTKVAELTDKIDKVEEQARNQECLKCATTSAIELEQKQRIQQLGQKLDEIAELASKAKELCEADDSVDIAALKNLVNLISETTSH